MSDIGDRLRDERKRLGLNLVDFAELGGVKKNAQMNYESGERAPDTNYLQSLKNAGVDIVYVLTGLVEGSVLNAEETELLNAFRGLDERGKTGVFSLMQGISPAKNAQQNVFKGNVGQIVQGDFSTDAFTLNVGKNKNK
jgi:transcriptional regulator with XRE-family HTH domain